MTTRFYARTNDSGSGRRFARTSDTGVLIPSITSLSSHTWKAGDSVTITGLNFNATKGAGSVVIAGVTCTTTSWADTSVVFTVPSTLMFTGSKTLVLTVNSGQTTSNAGNSFIPNTGYIFEQITAVLVASTSAASGVTGLAVGDEIYLNTTATRVGGIDTATVSFIGDGSGTVHLTGVTVDGDYAITGINIKDLTDGTSTSNGPKTLTYDTTAPIGYTVDIAETTISDVTSNLINVTIAAGEVGSTYNYNITSSAGGSPLIGTGTITTAPQSLAPISTATLSDGTLTFSLTLTDIFSLVGAPVSDTVVKFTDRTANAFTFTPVTNAAVSTLVVSSSITVAGLTTGYAAACSVINGDWRKNGGAFQNTAGTVVNGDVVEVRQTTSSLFSTTIGTIFNINGVTGTFQTTTAASDAVPNAFTFMAQTNVAINTTITSDTATISGINTTSPVTVTGGTWAKNGGGYSATAGTVVNGDTVSVRQTSANAYNTSASTVLTIGGVNGTFTTTTQQNGNPTQFTFTDQTGVDLNATITSAPVTISGITIPAVISVTSGLYNINGGVFTASAGTVVNGDVVRAQAISAATIQTATNVTVTVGTTSDIFTVTTNQTDSTPDQFNLIAQTNVPLNTLVVSDPVTISGINVPSVISIVNGAYSIDGGAFTSSNGTILNGQTVRVRQNSSSTYSTAVNTSLTIGGVSSVFTSTTLAAVVDTTPDAFSFNPLTNVALNTQVVSQQITVSGINAPAAISIAGGEYSIDGGAFSSLAAVINNGQKVAIRQTSSFNFSTVVTSNLTIGGVTGAFSSTTLASSFSDIVESIEYTDEQLIQFILDNNGNPPNTDFGIYTNALNNDDLRINYIANTALPDTVDDNVQLNPIHGKLLRHYITGNALRGNNDALNRQLGAEELALYEDEITKLAVSAVSEHIPEDQIDTDYNGIG